VIHANRAGGQRQVANTQTVQNVAAHRAHGFLAQPANPPGRVVSCQGGQIDAADCLEQPCGLVIFLDRPALGHRRGTTLNRAAVNADTTDELGRPGHARVALEAAVLDRARLLQGKYIAHGDVQ
jgi:hypothetical protein